MFKIVYILVLVYLLAGCALIGKRGPAPRTGINENQVFLEEVKDNNLTNNSFIISKAEVKIFREESFERVLASIKFEFPDKYLFSIRTRTGIELLRILVTGDTVLANDRINKRLYYGSPGYLSNKYGVSSAVMGIIFGDFLSDKDIISYKTDCLNGKLEINRNINGLEVHYVIDCAKKKVISARLNDVRQNGSVGILVNNFYNVEGEYLPGTIIAEDLSKRFKLEINFVRVDENWDGIVEFVPGIKYDLIELL